MSSTRAPSASTRARAKGSPSPVPFWVETLWEKNVFLELGRNACALIDDLQHRPTVHHLRVKRRVAGAVRQGVLEEYVERLNDPTGAELTVAARCRAGERRADRAAVRSADGSQTTPARIRSPTCVSYRRAHSSPRVSAAPRWDSSRTEHLFADACGSCHSYRTRWPWYSNVAPVSWLVQHDVDDGRRVFNVSRWDHAQPSAGEIAQVIREGEMPPLQYKAIHGEARLSSAEKEELIRGLERTSAADPLGDP